MNHVNAMTGTVLGGASMSRCDECAHGAVAGQDEGALAAFVSSFAKHATARHAVP